MVSLPESHVDLLERPVVAILATTFPNGTPHLTPVWIDHDGDDVLVNTATGRQKLRNLERNPRAGVCAYDPDDPYRYLSLHGRVVATTGEGADDHIDELARRYMGVDEYPNRGAEDGERRIVRIRPERVLTG